jgi:CIC family chloride channel protein
MSVPQDIRHTAMRISLRNARLALGTAQRILRSSELAQIIFCALIGALIGAIVAGLRSAVDVAHQIGFLLPEGFHLSSGIGADPVRILIVPALGGLSLGLASVVVRRFRATEIVDPVEANALHGGRMSLLDSLRLTFATFISNVSGASLGMEAGYSQLGSGIFSSLGQYFRLRRADQRVFVTAGAAAAIAAAFNTPLAGAFYGYELILGSYTPRALAPVAVAALTGTLIQRVLTVPVPLFEVSQVFHFKESLYLLFALMGIDAAGFSIATMQAVVGAERVLKNLPLPTWLKPALGGALVTSIALYIPQVLGSGHGAIQFHFEHQWALWPLVLLLFGKLVASAISIGSGYRGGMFSSSLFLGCLFGAVFADAAAMIDPHLAVQHTALMMVGMGAVAASIIGAPLTMVFLVLEGTGNFQMTAGVLVGVIVASTIVRLGFGYSFSTWRFHQRGIGIKSPHDIGWLADLTVARLMRADPQVLSQRVTLGAVRDKFPLGSAKRIFVVDDKEQFVGILDLDQVYDAKQDNQLGTKTAGALVAAADAYLLPFQNIRSALIQFEERQVESLPVIASTADRRVVGFVTEAYALRRYNQELERRRSAELGEQSIFVARDS